MMSLFTGYDTQTGHVIQLKNGHLLLPCQKLSMKGIEHDWLTLSQYHVIWLSNHLEQS